MTRELRFEARDLKPYAEPVSPSELQEGVTYFSLVYLGEGLLTPLLEPIVFVGRNLDPDDVDVVLYFQDFEAYQAGIKFDPDDQESFISGPEDGFKCVFEFERALDGLLRCSLKRKKKLNHP